MGDKRQRILVKQQIYEQVIESMKLMIAGCENRWEEDPNNNKQYRLFDYETDYALMRTSAIAILKLRSNQKNVLTAENINHLQKLWNNDVIQSAFSIRNEICLPDSTAYFLNDFDRITSSEYIPSDLDLLMVRYRTTGMEEKTFLFNNAKIKVCDVGGERNERRKWIHFFTNITSVVFVVSLSCYDEVTFWNASLNAMVDSLNVFNEQVNGRWFTDTPFILIFSKSDLFEEKVKKVPINVCPSFAEYDGIKDSMEESLAYIKDVFVKRIKNSQREISIHVINATDKDQVEKVLDDVHTVAVDCLLERDVLENIV